MVRSTGMFPLWLGHRTELLIYESVPLLVFDPIYFTFENGVSYAEIGGHFYCYIYYLEFDQCHSPWGFGVTFASINALFLY